MSDRNSGEDLRWYQQIPATLPFLILIFGGAIGGIIGGFAVGINFMIFRRGIPYPVAVVLCLLTTAGGVVVYLLAAGSLYLLIHPDQQTAENGPELPAFPVPDDRFDEMFEAESSTPPRTPTVVGLPSFPTQYTLHHQDGRSIDAMIVGRDKTQVSFYRLDDPGKERYVFPIAALSVEDQAKLRASKVSGIVKAKSGLEAASRDLDLAEIKQLEAKLKTVERDLRELQLTSSQRSALVYKRKTLRDRLGEVRGRVGQR